MNVFISHIYEERKLAAAFKNLIEKISDNQIQVWYSSDPRPSGGMELGDWRKKIKDEIVKADVIIAIVTPDSNGMTWVAWESGFAQGQKMELTPLIFFMKPEKLHTIYGNLNAYRGDRQNKKDENTAEISRLCALLLSKHDGHPIREAEMLSWEPDIEQYLERIQAEQRQSYSRSLFHDHFHNAKRATQLEDKTWYAKWANQLEDGTLEVFEVDSLTCWSTDTRLRMVGDGAKGEPYPMEGVVSSNGHVALSYWSAGNTPICGTVLMEPSDLTGEIYEGTWSGFTEHSLKAKNLKYFQGRVVMALDKETADNWVFT